MAYQSANQAKHTIEQEFDGSDDLEQRYCEKGPERVELLLGMRHALELAPGAIDGSSDTTSKLLVLAKAYGRRTFDTRLLQQLGEMVLLRSSLGDRRLLLCVPLEAAVGIKTLDDTIDIT